MGMLPVAVVYCVLHCFHKYDQHTMHTCTHACMYDAGGLIAVTY